MDFDKESNEAIAIIFVVIFAISYFYVLYTYFMK